MIDRDEDHWLRVLQGSERATDSLDERIVLAIRRLGPEQHLDFELDEIARARLRKRVVALAEPTHRMPSRRLLSLGIAASLAVAVSFGVYFTLITKPDGRPEPGSIATRPATTDGHGLRIVERGNVFSTIHIEAEKWAAVSTPMIAALQEADVPHGDWESRKGLFIFKATPDVIRVLGETFAAEDIVLEPGRIYVCIRDDQAVRPPATWRGQALV